MPDGGARSRGLPRSACTRTIARSQCQVVSADAEADRLEVVDEFDLVEGELVGRNIACAAAALARPAASFSWSNAGSRVPSSVSTRMNSRLPPRRSLRYQKRLFW